MNEAEMKDLKRLVEGFVSAVSDIQSLPEPKRGRIMKAFANGLARHMHQSGFVPKDAT
jgi:hypothetical protein